MARPRKKPSRRKLARRRPAPAPRSAPVNLIRDLPATPASAERALEDTMRALGAAGGACGDMDEVKMALREALNNAVRHGSRLNPRKRVHFNCRYDPKQGLEFVVRDEGNGFDPKKIPDPTQPENLERFSGRGIYMIRRLMDKVEFRDHGRELRMRRRPRKS